jgi:aspartate/methionine/tyrosine aminotransferase
VQIEPFAIERFYERWEFRAELMLSSSDCESRAVSELLALEPDAQERLLRQRLGYTEVPGSEELREAIAGNYESVEAANVLSLAAAEEGIFTAYHALLGPGDHAIVQTPCYGSALEVARSTGAEVSTWRARHEHGWVHDPDELASLIGPHTRLIYINSPHNPTGAQMSPAALQRIVELARERSIALFSDEVYRGLEHDPADRLPAACDLYDGAISLGTVSKAHGLPGLRIGWLACRDHSMIRRITDLKLYTTICSSAPSELLVALALRHGEDLVAASRRVVLRNLPLVEDLIRRRGELFEWVAPRAGPIGFPKVLADVDVEVWCEETAERSGVLLLPGSVYGEPRHVRMGFGRENLPLAIERLDSYLG